MAIINDHDTYLREIYSKQEHPTIDFSTHTLLAIGLETRGLDKVNPVKEGNKVTLKVYSEIPRIGPAGVVPRFFSVIVPKADSANVSMEIKVINVE